MSAFTAAIEAGTHALETDVHLSRDDVVVLSHDPTLRRCFGKEGKILNFDWDYLKGLRCLKDPHEGMPRLLDLLEYLASPALDGIWLLLDIKADNNLDKIMSLIAHTICQAPPSLTPWTQRIVLGCWAAEYLPLCYKYLPHFPITHIGFSLSYARHFLAVPDVSFNLLQKILIGPAGARFLRDARAARRPVYAWTVNERAMMRWCIRRGVDGVLTNDPGLFLSVCEEHDRDGGVREEDVLGLRAYLGIVGINLLVMLFGSLFRWRYGFSEKSVYFQPEVLRTLVHDP